MKYLLLIITMLCGHLAMSHPTGNMVVLGEYVVWPYIDPLDDPAHHACIMVWKEGTEPVMLYRSEFTASDFMLYSTGAFLYALERRYIASEDHNEIRLLRFTIGQDPVIVLNWTADPMRVGEGGFFIDEARDIIFATYPSVFRWTPGEDPVNLFSFPHDIKRLRLVGPDRLLLLGESSAWLTDQGGRILKEWNDLPDDTIVNPPLNRNTIFDADYQGGKLLLAYWGGRRFDVIDPEGVRKTFRKSDDPLTPHWVAWQKDNALLFASKIVFDGTNPMPELVIFRENGSNKSIWKK